LFDKDWTIKSPTTFLKVLLGFYLLEVLELYKNLTQAYYVMFYLTIE